MPLLMVLFILRTGCAPADNLEDLEAAQFPNPFQLKRSINNIVARVYGHSPSTFEKLANSLSKRTWPYQTRRSISVGVERYIEEDGSDGGVIVIFATRVDLEQLFTEYKFPFVQSCCLLN